MRFTFLGTGTSAGVPAIACDCAVCKSTDPRDRRLRTSAMIQFTDPSGQDRMVLIDAGPDLRQQMLRENVQRCDAILFTHNHVDHTFGLDEVRRFNVVMQRAIDIYAEDHTIEHLHRVYKHIFDRDHNVNDSFVATLVTRRLQPDVTLDLFGLRVTPVRFLHGRLPVVGFRFEAGHPSLAAKWLPLVYATDVSAVPTDTWRQLTGLNTLVLDALRHRRHPTHLTLGQSVSIAHRVGAESTYFVHMAHDLAHEQTNQELAASLATDAAREDSDADQNSSGGHNPRMTMQLAFDGQILE